MHLTTPFSQALRKALLAFVLGSVLAASAYSVYSWTREQQDIKDNLVILSGFLASATQSFFDDVGNGLEPLGQLVDRAGVLETPESARDHLEKFRVLHPEVGAMAVFLPSGAMLINTAVKAGQPLPDFRTDPAYITQLMVDMDSTKRYIVGRPEFGKALGLWRFAFRHTVRDAQGTPRFLVQAAIPLDREGTFLHKLPVPPASFIGILRDDGYQQARWPAIEGKAPYGKLSEGPAAKMIAANPGINAGVFGGVSPWSAQEGQRIGAFKRLERANMYAYVSVPESYIAEQWWRHNAPILLSLGIGLGIFAVGAYRVTQRERSHSRELLDQARRDALTGLPNRPAIDEIVRQAIKLAHLQRRQLAVLFIDLDRFKNINDAFGHVVGDQLIIAASKAIQAVLRGGDALGRFGGDEFMILLHGCNVASAAAITERLLNAFQIPLDVGSRALQITPSIGIAIYPDHGADIETLTKHADTAMHEAKRKGGSSFAVYANDLGDKVRMRLETEHQLRDAIKNNELRLVYQPIVDMSNGHMVGVEALLRWQTADGKSHPPLEFIGIAEDSGLIIPIGEWVMRTACTQLKLWNEAGHDLWVAVNLSVRQFQDPHLEEKVALALHDSGIDPSQFELEITESAAMHDPEMSVRTLGRLKNMGLRIAIDDFGTGYSSLSYLKRIPADKIKVDKSFVDGINIEVDDTAIVRTILALVSSLEKTSLAEGIETQDQFNALRQMGCQFGQGYWMSRPIDAASIDALLQKSGVQIVAMAQFQTQLLIKPALVG